MTQLEHRPSSVPERTTFVDVWERYGGGDIPATIGGLLAAIGTLVMLAALISAGAGNIAYQVDTIDIDGNVIEFSLAGAITAIVVTFVAFFVGGWVAARMARFDGRKNGLIVALWMLTLVVVFGALGIWAGAEYNVFAQIDMPDWVSTWDNEEVVTAAALAASAAALAMFGGAYLGGAVGENYNVKTNAAIANARHGSVVER